MHKILRPKVRVVAIRVLFVVMVIVIGRAMLGPMPWMHMSSRGIHLISLRRIN